MATPIFACGFECRYVGFPQPHWDSMLNNGFKSIQNTYARNGGYALRVNPTADVSHAQLNLPDPVCPVVRFYLYFVSLPGADVDRLYTATTNGGTTYALGFTYLTSTLNLGVSAGSKTPGPTVTTGTWYRIDLKLNADDTAGHHLLDWRVDGSIQTQVSNTIAASSFTAMSLGSITTSTTFDVVYDDVLVSVTAGDYPLGAGYVIGYLPGATSGTHSQTAGDLKDDASTNVTNGDSTGGKTNEATPDTTSYVKQVITRAAGYWEGIYATSGATAAPRAVEQVVATRAVTAGANVQKAQLYDGTSAADSYSLTSTPNLTLLYQRKHWAAAPSTGAWTLAKFQAARIRWGFENEAADGTAVTYPPALSWTILEAEYSGDFPSSPTWTTPADTVSMSTTPDLKFNSPASAAKQHFKLLLDTANTFNTGDLRTLDSSTDQTGWTYYDGSAWQALPSDGLPIAKAGNEVCHTVQTALSSTTWYRKVCAGTLI